MLSLGIEGTAHTLGISVVKEYSKKEGIGSQRDEVDFSPIG